MTTHVESHVIHDRLADFTRDKRILILAAMATVIGIFSAVLFWISTDGDSAFSRP